MQLHVVAVLCQIGPCGIQHARLQRQLAAGFRARNECANTLRVETGECVATKDLLLQKRGEVLVERFQLFATQYIVNDDGAVLCHAVE